MVTVDIDQPTSVMRAWAEDSQLGVRFRRPADAELADIDAEDLYVAEAQVDCGPTRRGILPRARGRMDRIHHRTSHITVVLSDERPTEEEA